MSHFEVSTGRSPGTATPGAALEAEVLRRIPAAVVDGEIITLFDALRHARTNNGLEFVSHAIDGHLITRAIRRHGVRASAEDIERTLGVLRREHGIEDDDAFADWLEASGRTEEALRADIRHVVEFGRLKGEVTRSLDPLLRLEPWSSLPVSEKGALRDTLFQHWLAQERAAASVELPLEQLLAPASLENGGPELDGRGPELDGRGPELDGRGPELNDRGPELDVTPVYHTEGADP